MPRASRSTGVLVFVSLRNLWPIMGWLERKSEILFGFWNVIMTIILRLKIGNFQERLYQRPLKKLKEPLEAVFFGINPCQFFL